MSRQARTPAVPALATPHTCDLRGGRVQGRLGSAINTHEPMRQHAALVKELATAAKKGVAAAPHWSSFSPTLALQFESTNRLGLLRSAGHPAE